MQTRSNNDEWVTKSLVQLEGRALETNFDSHLVLRIAAIYQKPINHLSVEDLRIMIGQGIGLNYLMPLALEILEKDTFVEGDYYQGDLLQNILKVEASYWKSNVEHWNKMDHLVRKNMEEIKRLQIDDSQFPTALS